MAMHQHSFVVLRRWKLKQHRPPRTLPSMPIQALDVCKQATLFMHTCLSNLCLSIVCSLDNVIAHSAYSQQPGRLHCPMHLPCNRSTQLHAHAMQCKTISTSSESSSDFSRTSCSNGRPFICYTLCLPHSRICSQMAAPAAARLWHPSLSTMLCVMPSFPCKLVTSGQLLRGKLVRSVESLCCGCCH